MLLYAIQAWGVGLRAYLATSGAALLENVVSSCFVTFMLIFAVLHWCGYVSMRGTGQIA